MKKRKSFEATTGHRIYTCIDGELFGNDEVWNVVVVVVDEVVVDDDVKSSLFPQWWNSEEARL